MKIKYIIQNIKDVGNLWYKMKDTHGHGGGAISYLVDEKFRIFYTNNEGIYYSDTYGRIWEKNTGTIDEEFRNPS